MAHGERAEMHGHRMFDREYWSRRCPIPHGMTWGKVSKRLTHRAERNETRKVEREALTSPSLPAEN